MSFHRTWILVAMACVPASAVADRVHRSELVPVESARGGDPNVSNIIYVNGCFDSGCAIVAGDVDDAGENISQVPRQDSMLSPFMHDQATWDATIACLREVYGPYDVQIVTQDPENVVHHEAVLAGHPSEMGLDDEIAGAAPIDCTPLNNAMSFSFANVLPDDPIELCWTVAQESAHSFGLDHAYNCLDPMTYLPGCGQKFFRNKDYPCGEFATRTCRCSGASQNSHQRLTAVFGEGTLPPGPALSIARPGDGELVGDQFSIAASASDQRLVDKIELYINGWLYETKPGHMYDDRADPYPFTAPSLADSVLDVELRAYNDLVSTSATVRVIQGAPCTSSAACLDGQACDSEGRCVYPPPTGELGDACVRPMDCVSHVCSSDGTEQLCSESCEPGVASQCPDGFACRSSITGDEVCWPDSQDTGGCCGVGAGGGPTSGYIALLVLVALGLRRRRSALGA